MKRGMDKMITHKETTKGKRQDEGKCFGGEIIFGGDRWGIGGGADRGKWRKISTD